MKELSVSVVDYEVSFYDWLTIYFKIHLSGPDFSIGTDISIVTDPADTAPIIKVRNIY